MIKKELDKKLQGEISDNETRAILDAQARLTNWMTRNLPGYRKASNQYARESSDILQMRVGQKLENVLTPDLGSKERVAKLSNLIDNEKRLLKQTGGFSNRELDAQLKPENMDKINRVMRELDINAEFGDQAAKGAMSKNLKDIVGSAVELPHVLNNAVVIVNNVLRRVYGSGKLKTLKELSDVMQDPQRTAALMDAASKKEANALRFLINAQKAGALAGQSMVEAKQ
jgi:hypothetical protein